MGSWYNKYEMAKRIAIFHMCGTCFTSRMTAEYRSELLAISGSLGTSFGGYLQAAVYETLGGAHGIGVSVSYLAIMSIERASGASWLEVRSHRKFPDFSLTCLRWLYIVCGCMTVPCGLALLFVLPDLPHNTRAWYLNEAEKEFALKRALALGRVGLSYLNALSS